MKRKAGNVTSLSSSLIQSAHDGTNGDKNVDVAPKKRKPSAELSLASRADQILPASTKKIKSKQNGDATIHRTWKELALAGLRQPALLEKVASSSKFVGAHVGITGGIDKSPIYAAESGCRAFALFLRNQRTWKLNSTALDDDNSIFESFRRNCTDLGFNVNHILPHGSYLLNAGAPDPVILEKTRLTLIHEVKLCEKFGIPQYNFHPGSSCGKIETNACLERVAETINFVLQKTAGVTLVLETMAKQGNTVGGSFEELKTIIDLVNDKSRIGVCLDTCHVFAAGYDIRHQNDYDAVMSDFDRIIGLQFLKAIHLNDSKGKLGSKVDRHANIGKGEIGLDCFRCIMNDERLNNMPLILETPLDVPDADEVAMLYKF